MSNVIILCTRTIIASTTFAKFVTTFFVFCVTTQLLATLAVRVMHAEDFAPIIPLAWATQIGQELNVFRTIRITTALNDSVQVPLMERSFALTPKFKIHVQNADNVGMFGCNTPSCREKRELLEERINFVLFSANLSNSWE